MGNVSRALKKSQQGSAPQHSAVHVVSMALDEAEQMADTRPGNGPAGAVTTESAPTAGVDRTTAAVAGAVREASRVAAPPASRPEADQQSKAKTSGQPGATQDVSSFSPLILTHHRPRCQVSEQIRQMRTALIRLAGGNPVRCLLTSSQAGEGKTVTAVNLAYTFSELTDKRTLLVDADLRQGSVASLFGMTPRHGLADLLAGDCTLEKAIRSVGRPNFHVIPAGAAKSDSIGGLLTADTGDHVMAELGRRYDFIVIDSPPVIGVADAGILGRWVTMAVLAVRLHKTRRDQVELATEILEGAGVPVSGLIAVDAKAVESARYRCGDYAY